MDKENRTSRKRLSLSQKVKIIHALDNGSTVNNLAMEYGVGKQTIRDIKSSRSKILEFVASSDSPSAMKKKKSMKKSTYDDLDKALILWFNQERSSGTPISGTVLAEQAQIFFKELRIEGEFKATNGWLARFKARHGIRVISVQGEKLSCDATAAEEFKTEFRDFMERENLVEEQIYNADEAGLYWQCLPSRTLASESEKNAPGFKPSKQRVTVLCVGNASGTHKLQLVVIGTAKKPRPFSRANVSVNNLPVKYYHQTSAWMNAEIFRTWFADVFVPEARNHLRRKGLPEKAVLLLDNAKCHPSEEILKSADGNFVAKFLPPNVTPLIQPMDQGVIAAFKKRYRGNLLQEYVKEGLTLKAFWEKRTILGAIYDMAEAWGQIADSTLKNGWNKLLNRQTEEMRAPEIELGDVEVQVNDSNAAEGSGALGSTEADLRDKDPDATDLAQLAQSLEGGELVDAQDIEQWLNCDNETPVFECLTTQDIVNQVTNEEIPTDKLEGEDLIEEEPASRISHSDALLHIEALMDYFEGLNHIHLADKITLRKLRGIIKTNELSAKKQKTIKDFF